MSVISGVPAIAPLLPQLRMQSGGRDVVASGTVITANSQNLEFQLAHLRVVFNFVTDGGQTRLGPSTASGSALHLTLYEPHRESRRLVGVSQAIISDSASWR